MFFCLVKNRKIQKIKKQIALRVRNARTQTDTLNVQLTYATESVVKKV